MNRQSVNQIIENYVEEFDRLKQGETYKWVALKHFQDNWDLEAEDFGAMFKYAFSKTINLVDNIFHYPTSGIVLLAGCDNEKVRVLFRQLFSGDNEDAKAKQDRMDDFITRTNQLLDQAAPKKVRYKQDLRTAITYMFFRYPDDNYLYKSTEAHTFAQYMEYENDFGSGKSFKLESYYDMCDQLLNVVKESEQLLAINQQRLDDSTWPDSSHHLLATDIIFCAPNYTLFRKLEIPKKNKKTVLAKDDQSKKSEIMSDMKRIEVQLENIRREKTSGMSPALTGMVVHHKNFGFGKVMKHDLDRGVIIVRFPNGDKTLGLPDALINKMMSVEDDAIMKYYEHISELGNEERRLSNELKVLEIELQM